LATVVEEDELRLILERPRNGFNVLWSNPGPPCRQITIGRSRIIGPSGTSSIPATSK